MNGKKAKQIRQEAARAASEVMGQIKITIFGDGRVQVAGFPNNLPSAMSFMAAGTAQLAMHFANAAKLGNMDDEFNIEAPRIVTPPPGTQIH